ncbi:MAG: molecular chaperone HtpG [Solobacterium sp.]|nr:molecular chaperone HtpG [Solobacterium sp.]
MAKKQFKAESKRLLGLMINSIYTNKEIFLRELISNASDALDKRYYMSLTNDSHKVSKKELKIQIEPNLVEKTVTIRDSGIGMTKEEMENNLGTIAHSGSAEFKDQLEKASKNIDIIGQFGVGFYSSFMVAKKVTVRSRSALEEIGHEWVSTGEDGYSIQEVNDLPIGTSIILELKDDTKEENYSHYLEEGTIRSLIQKYSDYVRYPIEMEVEKSIPDPTEESKFIITKEVEVLNSMVPLWKKNKNKVKPEEYNEFYKSKFNDWKDPQKVLHYSVEGNLAYTALLFIPSETPYNFYNQDYEPGLQLYSKGVFILDHAKDLLPERYRFITGLVDSDDISLNISREILQQDRQVKALSSSLSKKIHNALVDFLEKEREEYEKFYHNFGLNFKYDIYKSFGASSEELKDLLLFYVDKDGKYISLKEYVSNMKEEQKDIYYVCGSSLEDIEKLPALSKIKEKGYDILYLTDPVDEFMITMLREYDGKQFRSVTKGDLDLENEEEKKEREEASEKNKDLLSAMKEVLKTKVNDVHISSRLTEDPVCIVAEEGISLEMEKILSRDPMNPGMKASKILEINPNHKIFETLKKKYKKDKNSIQEDVEVLYDLALLIQGLPIENPAEYAKKIANLMVEASK